MSELPIAPKPKDRLAGTMYLLKGESRIWTGKIFNCQHNKKKNLCIQCKGASICEHSRQRLQCKECNGPNICEHGVQKYTCSKCKGGGICNHGRRRYHCKDCDGKGICDHDIIRRDCKICKGSGICGHGKRRMKCRECKGTDICVHDKDKYTCRTCFLCPESWCKLCTYILVINSPYKPYCFSCYCHLNPDLLIPRRHLAKENYLHDIIKAIHPTVIHNQTITGGTSNKRPDWLIKLDSHSIIIECDEDQHSGYNCEEKRVIDLFLDLQIKPLVVIRFNPDTYNDDSNHPGCFDFDETNHIIVNNIEFDKRKAILEEDIRFHISHVPTIPLVVIKLFYSIIET